MPAMRESMSGVDLAWLRMERPTNPMMVVAVLTLATRVRFEALRAVLGERLLRFDRFRQLPQSDVTGAHWRDDPHFELEAHLLPLTLPSRAGQAQLEAAASELASTPLDPRQPLWQMHLIERYRKGSALIVRFHHCYADGIALMRVLATLTDTTPKPPASIEIPKIVRSDGRLPFGEFLMPALALVQDVTERASALASSSLRALRHPTETVTLAQQVTAATAELARIATLSEDPSTPLRGTLSTRKQVVWSEPLSLDEVKTIGRVLDCTVNDVLLATVAGALGRFLQDAGVPIERMTIRGLVPVNLRPPEEEPHLGNHFGLVFAHLPVGERQPLKRLFRVHQDMETLKRSTQPILSLWLLAAMGLLPAAVEEQAIDLFTRKASLVISNVPGPQHPLYLAGARLDQQHFWVPQAGSIGTGVSLLTYDGRVHFGVMADRKLIAKPRSIARYFAEEFERLLLCVVSMQAPLERGPPPSP